MNKKTFIKSLFLILLALLCLNLTSCDEEENNSNRVVIWTSCREFAQYQELFNNTHVDCKVILVYKENPALSLPPAKDELSPDIIVGSWLNSEDIISNFRSLDYLFDRKNISSSRFYSTLLNAGKKRNTQYLLPVSFNIPCVIFSEDNSNLITDNYTLTLDQIKNISQAYNTTKKSGAFTRMGFTPICNDSFLYLVAKLFETNFNVDDGKIIYNKAKLKESIDYLKNWTLTANKSVQAELDFSFKYLQSPIYRQITSGKTLFAYTTSSELFKIAQEQDINLDYRWISQNGKIPVEDDMLMLGIYKKTENLANASEFITWFFHTETQDSILKRKSSLSLDTDSFGIAGGYSSIPEVTEKILPTYYTHAISNLPPAGLLSFESKYNARWATYETKVIQPYIRDTLTSENNEPPQDFSEYEKEWQKKVFD